jgi:hypothetical protein
MVSLLAVPCDERERRWRRGRRDQLYGRGQLLGRVMRHLLGFAPIEVALLARCVVSPAGRGLLIPPTGGEDAVLAPNGAARVTAVDVSVVAPAAEEEHLAAATTANEAQRVHVLAQTAKNWTLSENRATKESVATTSWWNGTEDSEVVLRGLALFGPPPWLP